MIWMNSMKLYKILTLVFLLFSGSVYAESNNVVITLDVRNIPSSRGNIMIYFYQNESEYLSEGQTNYSFFFPSKQKNVSAKIEIPKGIYGIRIYHDENENKILDKNAAGHPVEKFGYSNNFFGSYSKQPDFKNILLLIDREGQVITINMR